MQGLLSGLVPLAPLVTTQPKSCWGSHKEPGGRRLLIAMDEKVQQRDLWASTCVSLCVCVCVVYCDVNNNSFAHQWPWVSENMLQILIFADKAQSQGGRNEFYFKDLFHSTDYIPLHLRCLHSAHLSGCTDKMESVAQFYSLTYNAALSQWQFTAAHSLHLGLLCIYMAWTKVVPYYIHIFKQSTLWLLQSLNTIQYT